jgi:hypothetical protein
MAYNLPLNTSLFPSSYREACENWHKASNGLNAVSESGAFLLEQTGPAGEALSCNWLWLGETHARRVVVMISGTHGVEGFAGSAIECDVLSLIRGGELVLAADTAILMIHALNPWGYAWCRRCDHEGIDINRNFVDFSGPLPCHSRYPMIRDALLLEDQGQRDSLLADYRQQWGAMAYEMAVSGGQHVEPSLPFYGGKAPSFGREVIEQLMAKFDLKHRHLAVVDIHTGLGPYGYGEVICDHPAMTMGARRALGWYGPACQLPESGSSSSVPKTGLLDYGWHAIMDDLSCFVTLEFGTLGTQSLFETLNAETLIWAQAYPQLPDESLRVDVARRMCNHFNPDDDSWRESVLFRGRQVVSQALAGLSGEAGDERS